MQKNLRKSKQKNKKNKTDNDKEKLKKALIKKAIGYSMDEVVEEYVCTDEGEIKLSKRKITKKFVPPDLPAVKILLLQLDEELDLSSLTEEELKKEKQRLLQQLKESDFEEEE